MLAGGSRRYKDELLRHIDAGNLPDCYGGMLPFSWLVMPECIAVKLPNMSTSRLITVVNGMLSMLSGHRISPLRSYMSECRPNSETAFEAAANTVYMCSKVA
jgi:hypothetical protein